MFEKLLQKLLLTYFGAFVNGIDPNNLHVGIWSGDIKIQHVSLNQDKINKILSSMHLPLRVKFSSLGSLRILVPWNKLSSQPVDITIYDVLLELQLQTSYLASDIKDFIESKKQLIRDYCKHLLQQSLAEVAEAGEPGYLNKMFSKIIDNIQLSVNNLHLRLEGGQQVQLQYRVDCGSSEEEEEDGEEGKVVSSPSKPFACGFCLSTLTAYTTNNNWEKHFYDRTVEQSLEMRKKVDLSNISLYWQERNVVSMSSLKNYERRQLMIEIIGRKQKRLLSVSGEVKFIRNLRPDKPLYSLSTELEFVRVEMNYLQLKDIVQLISQVSAFNNAENMYKEEEMPEKDQLQLKDEFQGEFQRAYESDFNELSDAMSKTILKVNKNHLISWTKECMRAIIKRQRVEERQKEKNKKRWYNIMAGPSVKITQTEQQEIDKFIEQLMADEQKRKGDSLFLNLELTIIKGNISVMHTQMQKLMHFEYSGVAFSLTSTKDYQRLLLHLNVNHADLKYIHYEGKSDQVQKILSSKKARLDQLDILKTKGDGSIFSLSVDVNGKHTSIKISTEKTDINHNFEVVVFLRELSSLRASEEVKSAAWNRVVQLQKAQAAVQKPIRIYHVDVQIRSLCLTLTLNSKAQLLLGFQQVKIKQLSESQTSGIIKNFCLIFKQKHHTQSQPTVQYILQNISPKVNLLPSRKGMQIVVELDRLVAELNDHHVFCLMQFATKQSELFQQNNEARRMISEQNCYRKGRLRLLTVFKTWKEYQAVFVGGYIEFYEEAASKPELYLFIKNCKVIETQSPIQFKLQSPYTNQLIECLDKEDCQQWTKLLQQKILDMSSKEQLFRLADGQQASKVEKKIEHQKIRISVNELFIGLQTKNEAYRVELKEVGIVLEESDYHFQRRVQIGYLAIDDLSVSEKSQFRSFITNRPRVGEQRPVIVTIEGRKKLHPNYTGELELIVNVDSLHSNFNPKFLLKVMRLFSTQESHNVSMSQQQMENVILDMAHNLLSSQSFQQIEQRISKSKGIPDKQKYYTYQQYRKTHSSISLFKARINIKSFRLNLIHCTTGCCNGSLSGNSLSISIDNGNNFLFLSVSALGARLQDFSNYPLTINTLTQQPVILPYPLLQPTPQSPSSSPLSFTFTTFQDRTFINQQRLTTFISLSMQNYTLRYQQQPFMRFIDYLTNQLLGFIMNPASLDLYENPPEKEFKFGRYQQMTQKEVMAVLRGLLMPFFAVMDIRMRGMVVMFNSHPRMDAVKLTVEEIVIANSNPASTKRTEAVPQIVDRFLKKPLFPQLSSNPYFKSRILTGCFIQTYSIQLLGCQIPTITKSPFTLSILFQRLPNTQRTLLFPFLRQTKTLILEGIIPHLSLNLPKSFYNLINKCMMHNITYDDGKEHFFQHNFKFQHLMEFSDLSNKIKIRRLEVGIQEIGQDVNIGGFEFWFMRDLKRVNRMFVKGRHLEMWEDGKEVIMGEKEDTENYQLDFVFESEPNFDKKMNIEITHVTVELQLSAFMKIGSFVILDADCFPKSNDVGDLPAIVCNIHAKSCRINILQNQSHCYYIFGDIGYIWLRNRFMNFEVMKQKHRNKQLEEQGVYTSNVIFLRGVELIKCLNDGSGSGHLKLSKDKFRRLSGSIVAFIRINHLLKFTADHEIYYNGQFEYSLQNTAVVLSYADITQIMGRFSSPPAKPPPQRKSHQLQPIPPKPRQQILPPPDPPAPSPSTSTHTLIITDFSFQLLLSSPPAPVILIQLPQCKSKVVQFARHSTIKTQIILDVQYWNLKVGKWEPILEETDLSVELKQGMTKELLIENQNSIVVNVSVECLRLLNKLLADVAQVNARNKKSSYRLSNQQSVQEDKKVNHELKMESMSPYLIRNNLGCTLQVQSDDRMELLDSSCEVNYQMELQDAMGATRTNQPKKVKLTIKDENIINEIESIDLDRIKNKVIEIQDDEGNYYSIIFLAEYLQITKCITISSAYIVHNATQYDIKLGFNTKQLLIKSQNKTPLPYNLPFSSTNFLLDFPHLGPILQNFKFQSKRMLPNYEHYIISKDGTFNCNVQCQQDPSSKIMYITITPLFVFRNSLPCAMKLEVIWSDNGSNRIQSVSIGSQEERGFHEFGSRDAVSIRVSIKGFQFSHVTKIYDPVDKGYKLDRLEFSDYRGTVGGINIKHSRKHRVKKYTFYTQGFLINQTPYNLFCYSSNRLIPGQRLKDIIQSYNKICILDTTKSISLSLGQNQPNCSFSQQLNLHLLGNHLTNLQRDNTLHQLSISTGVYCIDQTEDLFSTIVQVCPKYILVNRCAKEIHVRHFQGSMTMRVGTGERVPLLLERRLKAHLIEVRVEDQDRDWMYSEAIDFRDTRSVVGFALRAKNDYGLKKCMRLEIVREFQYNYIIIQEIEDKAEALITIDNNLRYVRLMVYQSVVESLHPAWIEQKALQVRQSSSVMYGWDYPNLSRKLTVQLKFVGPLRSDFDDDKIQVDLSRVSLNQQFRKHNSQTGKSYSMKIHLQTVGPKITLKFQQRNDDLEDEVEEQVTLHFALSFKQFGLALIGENNKRRCELLYLSLKQFGLMVLEKKDLRTVQLKIKCISIENNSNHNTSNPVLLTPWKEQENQRSPRPFLVFLLEQGLRHKSITEIKSMRLCLQPTSIKIDDEFLERLFAFIKMIGNNSTAVEHVNLTQMVNDGIEDTWQTKQLQDLQSQTFIQQLQIAKISLIISFSMRPKQSSSNLLIYHILSSFGVALTKISESPITFSHIIMSSRNFNQLKKELTEYYRGQFLIGIYRIIGSINFFGNPYRLIRFFAEGIIEVVDSPVEGFIKGPIQGTVGIVMGGLGLAKNVIAGTFNSFELISESVSSGLSSLSMDQQFIQSREKIKNRKNQHVFSGLMLGTFSVYTGVKLALTGLYRQPVEGYRANGFKGGVAGTLKGVWGLLAKPLSAVFQGVSKTSQGIKNTALLFQDGPRTQRQRPPRVFYGQQFYYLNYSDLHSNGISILESASTKYLNLTVLNVKVYESETTTSLLMVTVDFLFLVDMEKKKVDLAVPAKNVRRVVEMGEEIVVEMRDGGNVSIPADREVLAAVNRMLRFNSQEDRE